MKDILRQKAGPLILREIKLVGDTFRPKRVHTKRKESSIVNATREESWLPLCHVEFMGGGTTTTTTRAECRSKLRQAE